VNSSLPSARLTGTQTIMLALQNLGRESNNAVTSFKRSEIAAWVRAHSRQLFNGSPRDRAKSDCVQALSAAATHRGGRAFVHNDDGSWALTECTRVDAHLLDRSLHTARNVCTYMLKEFKKSSAVAVDDKRAVKRSLPARKTATTLPASPAATTATTRSRLPVHWLPSSLVVAAAAAAATQWPVRTRRRSPIRKQRLCSRAVSRACP
jgi:hypothetical protein